MASTYSTLKIELIGTGEQTGTWGTTTNDNFSIAFGEAITGSADVAFSSADVTVTLTDTNGAQTARNLRLNLTGTSGGARNLILGSGCQIEKLYLVNNGLSDAVTVKNTTGTGIAVPAGKTMFVFNNGTNVVETVNASATPFAVESGGTGVTTSTGTGNVVLSASPTFTGVPLSTTASLGTNTTQIATTAFVLANGAPTGGLIMWGTGTAPSGWLLCAGAAVSRTTYAALFAVISTTFGVGDGSTTFNLPNYTNRFPYGTTLATTGGSADAVVVSHTHTATSTDAGHTHTVPSGASGASTPTGPAGCASVNSQTTATGNADITTTIATAGVSGVGANLPPYLGINFIIKT